MGVPAEYSVSPHCHQTLCGILAFHARLATILLDIIHEAGEFKLLPIAISEHNSNFYTNECRLQDFVTQTKKLRVNFKRLLQYYRKLSGHKHTSL